MAIEMKGSLTVRYKRFDAVRICGAVPDAHGAFLRGVCSFCTLWWTAQLAALVTTSEADRLSVTAADEFPLWATCNG